MPKAHTRLPAPAAAHLPLSLLGLTPQNLWCRAEDRAGSRSSGAPYGTFSWPPILPTGPPMHQGTCVSPTGTLECALVQWCS